MFLGIRNSHLEMGIDWLYPKGNHQDLLILLEMEAERGEAKTGGLF